MYDRRKLRDAATGAGHTNPNQLAVALGLSRMTAHRLWNGTAKPSDDTSDAVQAAFGIPRADLLRLAERNAA